MKLVTWNAQWCRGLDGVVSAKRIAESARALADFDVLCLQEIAVDFPTLAGDAGHDQPALLRELLPGFEVFFAPAIDEWHGGARRQFGNLIATRLPVERIAHHLLPSPADPGKRGMPRVCATVTVTDPQLGKVRIMTTHLEFYSKKQRMAQAQAVRDLHAEYCALAAAPPPPSGDDTPFLLRVQAPNAILCGDFNLEPTEPEYAALTQPFPGGRLWDAWRVLNGAVPHEPTFRVFDRTYGPDPIACDFVFVSDGLKDKLRSLAIDSTTKASDHQPVAVELR